jgi:hypothetical protein
LICFLVFSIGGIAGLSFFELSTKSKAIFTLSRAWTTISLFDKSEVNCLLIKEDGSQDKMCDGTNVGVGIPVGLTSLTVHVKSLVDSRGQ